MFNWIMGGFLYKEPEQAFSAPQNQKTKNKKQKNLLQKTTTENSSKNLAITEFQQNVKGSLFVWDL